MHYFSVDLDNAANSTAPKRADVGALGAAEGVGVGTRPSRLDALVNKLRAHVKQGITNPIRVPEPTCLQLRPVMHPFEDD